MMSAENNWLGRHVLRREYRGMSGMFWIRLYDRLGKIAMAYEFYKVIYGDGFMKRSVSWSQRDNTCREPIDATYHGRNRFFMEWQA